MNYTTDIRPVEELDGTLSLTDTLGEDHARYADIVSDLVNFEESHTYNEIKEISTAEELHDLDSSPETTVS
jgi:hypothetical protein